MRLRRPTLALLGLTVIGLTAVFCCWPNQSSVQAQPPPFERHRHWTIEFIPREAESVSLIINGKVWCPHPRRLELGVTWDKRRDGSRIPIALPPEFDGNQQLHIVAVPHPWNTQGEIIVRYGERERNRLTFSRAEEAQVVR